MEAPTNEIKEMLIKIKIDASYDANSKILQSHEVKLVQEALKYLEVGGEGLTKEGVIFMLLNKLYILMPHKFKECNRIISPSSESREVKCIGCETQL